MMNHEISRRRFLGTVALAGAGLPGTLPGALAADASALATSSTNPIPVIDTHIHLYDPFRPQGVPWPNRENKVLYQTSLPARYRPIAEPLGIVGAIEIECSSLLEDNQWVLDVAAKEDIMVGTVGHLTPGTPELTGFARTRSSVEFVMDWGGRRARNSTGRSLLPILKRLPPPTWCWTPQIRAYRCWPMLCEQVTGFRICAWSLIICRKWCHPPNLRRGRRMMPA